MKIMSLNIGQYQDNWRARKPRIIKAIMKEEPDVLLLQEVSDDRRHQGKDGLHQGAQLNSKLRYKTMIYDIMEQRRAEKGIEINSQVFDGLACLTNLQVLSHRVMRLQKAPDDKHYRGVQIVELLYKGRRVLFYNTHYSNATEWALSHFAETKEYWKSRNELPIVVGDLNILEPRTVAKMAGREFESAYDFKEYVSFPSKGEVLDYILIPRRLYEFGSVKCACDGCSDHRALITEIGMKT
mgnify:CR=1 FL=1